MSKELSIITKMAIYNRAVDEKAKEIALAKITSIIEEIKGTDILYDTFNALVAVTFKTRDGLLMCISYEQSEILTYRAFAVEALKSEGICDPAPV